MKQVTDYLGNPIKVGDEVIYLKDTINASLFYSKRTVIKIDDKKVYIAHLNSKPGCTRGNRLINLKYISLPF